MPGVLRGVVNHGPIMSLEEFGQNIGIEKGFRHPLERGGVARGTASFLVSDMDNLVEQRGIVRAAKQAKPLLENRVVGMRRVRQTMPSKPRIQLGQLEWS
jgi:hypothetical protein